MMIWMMKTYTKVMPCLLCSSERTAAEAKKLNDIKVELAKLETNLATDVSILRKQIDAASLRYMKAQ